jgi:hypothetical protein
MSPQSLGSWGNRPEECHESIPTRPPDPASYVAQRRGAWCGPRPDRKPWREHRRGDDGANLSRGHTGVEWRVLGYQGRCEAQSVAQACNRHSRAPRRCRFSFWRTAPPIPRGPALISNQRGSCTPAMDYWVPARAIPVEPGSLGRDDSLPSRRLKARFWKIDAQSCNALRTGPPLAFTMC